MGMDLLDVVAGAWINVRPARRRRPIFRRPMSRGLRYVVQYIGVKGLARPAGKQVIIVTTAGTANLAALEPATQLMESAKAGDSVAKAQILELANKADAGDALAKQTMGVLDVAAAGLKAAEQKAEAPAESVVPPAEKAATPPTTESTEKAEAPAVEAGKSYPFWVRNADGKIKKHSKLAHAIAWMAKHPGSKPANFTVTPEGRANKKRPTPQRPMPQRRPVPPGGQLVNPQQIAQSMQGMTLQQRQLFQQNLLAQQQANLQSGMFQPSGYNPYARPQPGYPAGYPQQSGYPYPQQSGYPAGYATPMQSGFPSGYVQQEQFEDAPPDDLMGDGMDGGGPVDDGGAAGDVEINDEAGE